MGCSPDPAEADTRGEKLLKGTGSYSEGGGVKDMVTFTVPADQRQTDILLTEVDTQMVVKSVGHSRLFSAGNSFSIRKRTDEQIEALLRTGTSPVPTGSISM